jgi:hypothetical protein
MITSTLKSKSPLVERDYEKPTRTEQGEMHSAAFPKMFICRLRLAQTQPRKREEGNAEQLLLLSYLCLEKEECRYLLFSVTPSPRTPAPPCLLLGIKDSLKEYARLFAFWMKGGFWLLGEGRLFDVGGFGREMN